MKTEPTTKTRIHKGDQVFIKPERQDAGDSKLTWWAVEDEDGGRVLITSRGTNLNIAPTQVVDVGMLQHAADLASRYVFLREFYALKSPQCEEEFRKLAFMHGKGFDQTVDKAMKEYPHES